jgi:predicted metal-dependent peptidase
MRITSLDALDAEARRRWSAARVWSAHQAPYLASALLALEPIVVDQSEDPPGRRHDLRALPVDRRWHVYLDPEVLAATDVPELGFWLVHQVSHLLRQHADRSPVQDADRPAGGGPPAGRSPADRAWNLAGDAEIDDDLAAGDLAVPPAAATPGALGLEDGLTAEQYWDALRPVPPGRDPGHGDGSGAGSGEGPPAGERAGGSPGAGVPAADCGSGCDGQGRPWDCGRPGLGPAGAKLVGRDVARRILEHQRQRGNVPAGWQRWADEVLEPTVNWRRLLAAAVRRGMADVAGRVDFTYRKPSRRSSVTPGVVLPSLRQPVPKVAMVLDTSGSMSDRMLAQCLGEVGGVLRSLGVARQSLRVVCCDAQAYEAQRVLDAGDVQLLGGGGTDMGAGLAHAAALRPRPDLIVVLTDGYTPWPARAPAGIRVVVGLLDPSGSTPPWAHPVLVDSGIR